MSKKKRSSRAEAWKAIAFGIALPVVFIGLALIQQGPTISEAGAGWWAAVLAFVVGAGVVALPRTWSYVALPIAVIASVMLTWVTKLNGFTFICFVLAGFAFGLAARSLILQVRARKAPVKSVAGLRFTWDEGEDGQGSADSPKWRDVDARITAMRGAGRSTVSIHRGLDRMDVLCVERAGFLVFCTGPSGRQRGQFQALPSGTSSPDPRDTVDVVIAGSPASYPRGRFVTRDDALAAAKAFVATGARDTGLTWDVGSRAHEIPVPPGLS
ncbi:hypothetical protein HII28_08435 [Planctomonas sp. JC2975]|uniref:Imm1 family immunity protein n=1 Tax=Planctomonas sp. JC2975 TaxID=2729626 RepID=UPI001476743D|nr:Imm1 family immunity protein [Planctomonas sp. JC2975]NNC11905.1 hypothetical protein [Planctomonas sp. JC2975]